MNKLIHQLFLPMLDLPRATKRLIAILVDCCLCMITVWLAIVLRWSEFVDMTGYRLMVMALSIGIAIPIFIRTGLYRAIFRYSGLYAIIAVARAVGIYALIYASIITVIGFEGVPRTIGIIQPFLLLVFVGSSRLMVRYWLGEEYDHILKLMNRPKVLIYGAGRAGRELARALANSPEMQVVGFLDDDLHLHGSGMEGLPIFNPLSLKQLVIAENIHEVLLAMPSISRAKRNQILFQIKEAQVPVKTLPSLAELIQGKVSIADLRELDIEDLLGRAPAEPDLDLMSAKIKDKVVLVTGAGGSIGSELCRQIIQYQPGKLLLIEHSELALYQIHQELENKSNPKKISIIPLLASVQNKKRIREILSTWKPETIFHAAAYKHVPLVEHNPAEGIKNNVFGTLVLAKAAHRFEVKDFILISTDKAVRPTNIMGASKRLAEMCLQAFSNDLSNTKYSMVRFGNVLGSSGSVVPKFRQQIRSGGPLTLTHPEIARYFMTIEEAAQLVIQASALARGGEVFVLDMGKPVKIYDLALRMIELSGLTLKDKNHPLGDIEIQITGLRPAEKLFEELLIGNHPERTTHPKIIKAQEAFVPWEVLQQKLKHIEDNLNTTNDMALLRSIIEELVPEYHPESQIVDWIHLENEEING